MATLTARTQANAAIGDRYGRHKIARVINAAAGRYVFVEDTATEPEAEDLSIVAATDATDATARSVPQVTTVAGATYGKQDAIVVASEITVDGRVLTAGTWYFPVATTNADVNTLVRLSASTATQLAKNILEFVTGDVNPLEGYQEDLAGADGKYYLISAAAAATVKITFKPLATYAAAGIQRIRVSCEDWSLSLGAVGVYETNGAEMIRAVNGFPDAGSEWIDFVVDVANNQFIVASGGDVQISQAIPTYTIHTEVPATIRLYLIDGAGVDAEGLWRKEPVTNAPNYIG